MPGCAASATLSQGRRCRRQDSQSVRLSPGCAASATLSRGRVMPGCAASATLSRGRRCRPVFLELSDWPCTFASRGCREAPTTFCLLSVVSQAGSHIRQSGLPRGPQNLARLSLSEFGRLPTPARPRLTRRVVLRLTCVCVCSGRPLVFVVVVIAIDRPGARHRSSQLLCLPSAPPQPPARSRCSRVLGRGRRCCR